MRRILRSPLTWIVGAEVVVVALLGFAAWHVLTSAAPLGSVGPSIGAADPSAGGSTDLPDLGLPASAGEKGPLPGLNLSSAFWRGRLADLNRDQAFVAQLEWRVVHAATDAARRYVESVVLPAVRRAERPGRG